eukprot:gb/GEZN01005762.1/.p1 GENE.gb/GEZN01005762.1/~~gb/GEZN01005762.1/.p1  ORF type:complete len:278 (+),score=18.55 gb/GEZN01005762.1/:35-868(+)
MSRNSGVELQIDTSDSAEDQKARRGFVGVSGMVLIDIRAPNTRSQLVLPDPNLATATYCANQRKLRNAELLRIRAFLLGSHDRVGMFAFIRMLPSELLLHVSSFLVTAARDYREDVLADIAAGRYKLPVYISCELQSVLRQECFLVATDNKQPWGAGGDGLTICGGVNPNHPMRSRVFGGLLEWNEQTRLGSASLQLGQWHKFTWVLHRERTFFTIDGRPVSVKSDLKVPEDLPSETPFLGVTNYDCPLPYRNFQVRPAVPSDWVLTPSGGTVPGAQ